MLARPVMAAHADRPYHSEVARSLAERLDCPPDAYAALTGGDQLRTPDRIPPYTQDLTALDGDRARWSATARLLAAGWDGSLPDLLDTVVRSPG